MIIESIVPEGSTVNPKTKLETEHKTMEVFSKKTEYMPIVSSKMGSGKGQELDAGFLQEVLVTLEENLKSSGVGFKFEVNTETRRTKVTVTDRETGETIREIPPEQVLNLMEKIDEMVGILFDEKA